jgi:glycosyltransferase involved in cell wall biosynthesis
MSNAFLRSDFILKIAGDGPADYHNYLEELVESLELTEKVWFIGHVEGKEKARLYANARFTFMPSHSENFGNVVLESLAQETPVLASHHTPWEVLDREQIGYWIDNTPEDLAGYIDKIIQLDDSTYQAMRSKCRDFVVCNFDIENNFDKWIEFYKHFE